ncbi:hypothetical protein, partial [Citrobacter sp. VF227]
PMAQRIVLFASTTGELAALLRAFVDGRDSPCLLDGAVTAAARAAGLDAAQLAQAAAWLAGKRVDRPPAGGTAKRVHLPAYPFAGRRCGAAGWARAEAGASRDCAAAGPCEAPAGVAAAAMTVAAAGPRVDATPSAAADRARGAARPAERPAARAAARRGAPAPRQPALFGVRRRAHTVQAGLHPLAGGGWVVTLEDVSTRKATEARADAMARLDPLTGLADRLLLRERLAAALERLARPGE